MATLEQLDLLLPERPRASQTTATQPKPAHAVAIGAGSWRLEWQKRGGRAGEDWVVKVGIMVAGRDGVVLPLHAYLRSVLRDFCAQLSIGTLSGNISGMRDTRALDIMAQNTLLEAEKVMDQPVEMPDNYAASCAVAMLWGNFVDTFVAILDSATEASPPTLCVDATTLAVVAPSNYSRKRAKIEGAEPCTDFYAVAGPDRHDRGWNTYTDEGNLAPSILWGLMNALNCQFAGPAWAGKDRMRDYCSKTTKRFLSPLHAEGVTREEIFALGASKHVW